MTQQTKEPSLLTVSASPHIKSGRTTAVIMRDVLIALAFPAAAAVCLFGFRVLLLLAVCCASAVISEWAFCRIVKKPQTLGDLSALVTGAILALNLPVGFSLWFAALGSAVAIVVVKELFGGIGQNFANPAITARVFLLVCFSKGMSEASQLAKWVSVPDLVTSATPLAQLGKTGDVAAESSTLGQLFFGTHTTAAVGEACVAALLLGALYLLIRRVITLHTPLAFILTVFLLTFLLRGDGEIALRAVLSGGLVFGAFYMATDYATTPTGTLGQTVFGVLCGIITVIIRTYGGYPEGVSLAILLSNILTPYIERLCRRRPLGGAKA